MSGAKHLSVVCLAILWAGPAFALDPDKQPNRALPQLEFKSVNEALRDGMKRLNDGDKPGAARVFNFAATQGNVAAQWKLGRMYADGDGVDQDDYKAFQYFSQIANTRPDEARGTMMAGVVAKAFVQLGTYHLEGIPGSPVRANPHRAFEMFHYAASFFGDPDAQYNVGRIFLDGVTGPKDVRQAARWLNLAAEKGHPYAQAVLGQILFNGQGGVPRQAPLGLSWILVAKQAVDPAKDAWVVELFQKVDRAATDDERKLALTFAKRHVKSGIAAAAAAER
ncbi:MAG TPA: tetratricopeptide repeat protein [Beijerinckiaceae bacterium]|nr:tetratricopeptide repeat protein [Beijerinckiaceae bacterium]